MKSETMAYLAGDYRARKKQANEAEKEQIVPYEELAAENMALREIIDELLVELSARGVTFDSVTVRTQQSAVGNKKSRMSM